MSVRVERLDHRYGRIEALSEICAVAKPGRITAILGPNAAGKSTLIKCIIGAVRPASGEAFIDDRRVSSMRLRELAQRVAYVPQRTVVSAAFTVREVIELGRYALPRDGRRINDALSRLELLELADRPYPALSVGQQQRVTLARALAQMAPDGHLVLDEPTAAMDLAHADHSFELLRGLADEGATVLMAMHDLQAAGLIADEAWILDGGRLVAAGSAADVLEPSRLEIVFGVGFEWVTDSVGRRRLIATGRTGLKADTI